MGLVRFVHPSHGGRTIRYRHVAGERWHLSGAELGVLAVLVLRGPQTVGEVRTRAERHLVGDGTGTVEEILDTLAARSPDPFAVRVGRRPGEREARWAQLLAGDVAGRTPTSALPPTTTARSSAVQPPRPGPRRGRAVGPRRAARARARPQRGRQLTGGELSSPSSPAPPSAGTRSSARLFMQ